MSSEEPNLKQYVLLRTILDSLETGALNFYLGAETKAQRDENFNYIQTSLTPIINRLWGRAGQQEGCPVGYHNCDGYCVSYPCIGSPPSDRC